MKTFVFCAGSIFLVSAFAPGCVDRDTLPKSNSNRLTDPSGEGDEARGSEGEGTESAGEGSQALGTGAEFLGGGLWERDAQWCNHAGGRIYIGDFNGDARADWLCHDVNTGYEWIDYADGDGRFYGTDWQRDAGWCKHAGGRLHIGDFNGDGRADWLCHDADTGYKWIDYANNLGKFLGTNWERDASWCNHANGRLHIGDFDGDGRGDWLCHDASTGYKWIDYASTTGKFWGTNWDRDVGWCKHATGELHVGDFDGNEQLDLLCHDTATGYKWIAYTQF